MNWESTETLLQYVFTVALNFVIHSIQHIVNDIKDNVAIFNKTMTDLLEKSDMW